MKPKIRIRNYKKEYLQYHGKPQQRKETSSRNKARSLLKKIMGAKKIKHKHVDHINHNPLDNRLHNLRIRGAKKNMADNKHKT